VCVGNTGRSEEPTDCCTRLIKLENDGLPENDLALLEIENPPHMNVPEVEFASPLRHGARVILCWAFPMVIGKDGTLADIYSLLMPRACCRWIEAARFQCWAGSSGAPVWSSDLSAFVGLVVTELSHSGVSWCIPSRRLCEFHPNLLVRFRIPPEGRPIIHDYDEDDPNVQLFGTTSDNGERRLTANIKENAKSYTVSVVYECLPGSPAPRGQYVTFVTYPQFQTGARGCV
jgi:hypothetical protein